MSGSVPSSKSGEQCQGCPYSRYPTIPPQPTLPARLAVVGEAPGREELGAKRPFVGRSGKVARTALQAAGLSPELPVYWSNALLCRPPQGKIISRSAIAACRGRLLHEMQVVQPRVILALGGSALHALTGDYNLKITRQQGNVIRSDLLPGALIVPALHPAKILRDPADYKTFIAAVRYAVSLVGGGDLHDPGRTKYEVIYEEDEVRAAIELLSTKPVVMYDIETTGLNPRRGDILTVGACYEKNRVIVFSKYALPYLQPLFELPNTLQAWHHGKFDTSYLRRRGYRARIDHDTLYLHLALNETPGTHDLEQLAGQYLGAPLYKHIAGKHIHSKKGLAGAPAEAVHERVATDVDYQFQLLQMFLPKVEASPDLRKLYYETFIPAANFLRLVERRGIQLDLDNIAKVRSSLREKISTTTERIQRMVSKAWDADLYVKQTGAKKQPRQFKPTSVPQLAWMLYDRLGLKSQNKHKPRSTDVDSIKGLPCPLVPLVLTLRGHRKALATYVLGMLQRMDGKGRIHTTFQIHGTTTGRLSSVNPGVQNITKDDKDIRNCFRARQGYVLVEADLKGAELRYLAEISGDEALTQLFRDGRDPHTELAISYWGPDYTHANRMAAKTINFGIPYGREAQSVAEELNIPVYEAQALIDQFYVSYPQAQQYLARCDEEAVSGHPIVSAFGHHRRFGLITPETVKGIQNEARNFRMQCTVSNLNLHAAMRMTPELGELDAHVINLIHDATLVECPNDPAVVDKTVHLMARHLHTTPIVLLGTTVPFTVEVSTGERWGELAAYTLRKEEVYD